ncbi:hypothetical protein U1Q18_052842 [Sarracenia purpurea var. burkii]
MRNLAGNRVDDAFLKPIFFKHLPVNVQQILDALPAAKLDDAAVAADKMVRYNVNSVNAIQTQQNDSTNGALLSIVQTLAKEVADLKNGQTVNAIKQAQPDPITMLVEEIKELKLEISELRGDDRPSRSRSRSRTHSRERFRNRSYTRDPKKHPTCWFHYRFGERARRCEEPCDYKQPNEKN